MWVDSLAGRHWSSNISGMSLDRLPVRAERGVIYVRI